MGQGQSSMSGDARFMEQSAPGSTRYVSDWMKKHDFSGNLDHKHCEDLLAKLRAEVEKHKNNRDKCDRLKLQVIEGVKWEEQAAKRQKAREEKEKRKLEEKAAMIAMSQEDPGNATGRPSALYAQEAERERRAATEQEARRRAAAAEQEARRRREETERVRQKEQEDHDKIKNALSPSTTKSGTVYSEAIISLAQAIGGIPSDPPPYGVSPSNDIFPAIQVANPHFGVGGDQERHLLVYRPWSESEMTEAVKGLGCP